MAMSENKISEVFTKRTARAASLRIIIPLFLTFTIFVLSVFLIFIPSLEKHMMAQKREMIRELINSSWNLLSEYNQRVRLGELTLQDAQFRATKRIQNMRYGREGKDYFWINDMECRMVMHPYRPDLVGRDLTDFKDPNGKNLFKAFVETVRSQKSGYVDYMWQWKDNPEKIVPKISYVKAFEPWDWIIGTGIYIEDVHDKIASVTRDLLKIIIIILAIVLVLSFYATWQTIKVEKKRRQAGKALHESEEKYRQIFENIQDVYFEINLEGKILEISPSIENMSQYTREDLLGKSLYDLYTVPEERDENIRILHEKQKAMDHEVRLTDKDGSYHICSIATAVIKDDQNKPLKLVGSLRDITKRKQVEEEKANLQDQLRQTQKMEAIGTLAGGIAHDFNNILSSVIGYTELALDDVKKGSLLESNLHEVCTAGERARDLVKQILVFARQTNEDTKPVKVGKITKEVLSLLRSSIPTAIEIKQDLNSDSLVMGSPTQIHQIFMNLCTNAAHAMEDNGGVLNVNVTDVHLSPESVKNYENLRPGTYVKLSVSDTGTGISPDIIDSIFQPFFTTKEAGEGTGMGLSVVHGIVKKYGGEINVESKLGKGTVFTIYLPVTKSLDESRPYQVESLSSGTEKILFVDDELPIVRMGSQMLDRLGYKVTTRTSSVEALALFRARPNDFDLVITDMTMPNMTGDKLAAALIEIRPDIPLILCTGYSKKISDESASELGIKAIVYKPIVRKDLAKAIRKVLEKK